MEKLRLRLRKRAGRAGNKYRFPGNLMLHFTPLLVSRREFREQMTGSETGWELPRATQTCMAG